MLNFLNFFIFLLSYILTPLNKNFNSVTCKSVREFQVLDFVQKSNIIQFIAYPTFHSQNELYSSHFSLYIYV